MEATDLSENAEGIYQVSTLPGNSTNGSRNIVLPACYRASKDACRVRDLFVSVYTRDIWPVHILSSLAIAVGLVSVAVNGVLSHYGPGESTHAQRVWTMTWLAIGIVYGTVEPSLDLINNFTAPFFEARAIYNLFICGRLLLLLIGCAPAIGGFAVVGPMLMSYGHCIQIGDAFR